jgi:hypothetical protein
LLAALAAGLAAPGLDFAPGLAFADDPQRIPLNRAFRYLDAYLGLPPPLRSRFYLVFRAMRNERPCPDLSAAIVGPTGARTPLTLDNQAQVIRLPTLGELNGPAVLEIPPGVKFRFATEIRPDVAPSTSIDVPSLDSALSQANIAIARLAGPFGAMAPRLDTILFPDAGSGQAVLANGRTAPLPTTGVVKALGVAPYYQPSQIPGARMLALARLPSRILFARDPKS